MRKLEMIPEEEAMVMMGLKRDTLRMFCMNKKRKKYNVRTSRISKTKIYYCKTDIQQEINNRAKIH